MSSRATTVLRTFQFFIACPPPFVIATVAKQEGRAQCRLANQLLARAPRKVAWLLIIASLLVLPVRSCMQKGIDADIGPSFTNAIGEIRLIGRESRGKIRSH